MGVRSILLMLGAAALAHGAAYADVTIVKTGPDAPTMAGTYIEYTITITNHGAVARDVRLLDALPAELQFDTLGISGFPPGPEVTCTLPPRGANVPAIDCTYAGLGPGASVEFDVYALLRYCQASGLEVTNTATASSAQDPAVSSQWTFFTVENPDPYCDDLNYCTDYEQCYDGECVGLPINGCGDNSVCTIDGCNPEIGCTNEPITCGDDGNPCTDTDCDPIAGCFHPSSPAGTPCPSAGPCIVGGVCDGTGSCTPVTVCDDGNACTSDLADASCACSHVFVAAGSVCDDGDSCTVQDACNGTGACGGSPYPAPAEVGNSVRLNSYGGPQQPGQSWITWSAVSAASTYDAVRGSLAQLPVGPGGGDEICVGSGLPASSYPDYQNPAPGAGYWYLLRGVNACAGPGPYGFRGDHGLPGAPRVSGTTCP